jgi:hypothetical protein
MNTIKLNQTQLENLTYEIASSISEIEEKNEELNLLFIKAVEMAYPVYKKEYNEEPNIDFDPEFSIIISDFLTKLLIEKYDELFIDEDLDDNGMAISACFYSFKKCEKHILIKDVCGIVYL